MVHKCHPCPSWKATAARRLMHCAWIQCTWDTCSETESSQDIYWSAIRLSVLLFLVLIELEAKWAQKETIKWLQLRSVINNVFFTQQKSRVNTAQVCSGGETWNSKNILFKFLSRLLQQAESDVLEKLLQALHNLCGTCSMVWRCQGAKRSMYTHSCIYSRYSCRWPDNVWSPAN